MKYLGLRGGVGGGGGGNPIFPIFSGYPGGPLEHAFYSYYSEEYIYYIPKGFIAHRNIQRCMETRMSVYSMGYGGVRVGGGLGGGYGGGSWGGGGAKQLRTAHNLVGMEGLSYLHPGVTEGGPPFHQDPSLSLSPPPSTRAGHATTLPRQMVDYCLMSIFVLNIYIFILSLMLYNVVAVTLNNFLVPALPSTVLQMMIFKL